MENQSQQQNQNQPQDELWQIAKKRVAFKWSLLSYIIVNSFLIFIWFSTTLEDGHYNYFWPKWPLLGWGIGIAFQYMHAFHSKDVFSVEKEYENLKDKNK